MIKKIKYLFLSFVYGLENLTEYFSVIWRDRQWDFFFIYQLLYKKLELVEKHMKSSNCVPSVNQDKYVRQVNLCKNLAKRLSEDNYMENTYVPFEKKYGQGTPLKFEEEEVGTMKFRRMINDAPPEERRLSRKCFKHSGYLRNQDKEMLFNCLKKYIENFWD